MALHDERPESPSAGRSLRVRIDARNGDGLVIPPGVWHTFRAVSGQVVLLNSKNPPYLTDGVVDKETVPAVNDRFALDWDGLESA
jgi:dTDP-4-dehydrorhamnose 3,5-epimerase and related enzymes